MASAERSSSKNTNNGEIIHHASDDDDDTVTVEIDAAGGQPAAEEGRFLDFLKAQPSRKWLQEAGVRRGRRSSPLALLEGRAGGLRHHLRVPFARRIRWRRLYASFAGWIKHPANVVFFLWLAALMAGIIVILLLMLGALNSIVTPSSRRKDWIEAGNQIVNALLTVMCIYQHPKLFHHLHLLLRWTPKDAASLRAKYCKYAAARPRERLHLAVVIGLLHLTCVAQYLYCGFYLAYSRTSRPDDSVTIILAVGVLAPTVAALYTAYGPLGREGAEVASAETPPEQSDPEGAAADGREEKRAVARPRWIGGLFDCWDDLTVFVSSLCCTCCVFGWNMERLGFGNMYVHVATFVLLCLAPVLVFAAAGSKIENEAVRAVVAGSGAAASVLGLLYGALWRIKMRRRFRLPDSRRCCGNAAATDCAKWLFCASCALAQEVRTGNFYDVEDYSFYVKASSAGSGSGSGSSGDGNGNGEPPAMSPLPREGVEGDGAMVAPEVVVLEEAAAALEGRSSK